MKVNKNTIGKKYLKKIATGEKHDKNAREGRARREHIIVLQ